MNVKLQSTMIIFATLSIGIAIGWFSASTWNENQRMKQFEKMRAQRGDHGGGGRFGMPRRMEQMIQPTADQEDTVKTILSKYHEKFIAKSARDFDFVRLTVDSLTEELKPILSEEQIEKLEERRHFFHPFPPGDRPPKGREFQNSQFGKPPDGRRRRDGEFRDRQQPPQNLPQENY
jgi:hypothetical protein